MLSFDGNLSSALKDALVCRLRFRTVFLKIVELADTRTSSDLKSLWSELGVLSSQLRSTSILGKPVPKSFSIKVQRKLASTVPPRPIVEIAQDTAYDHLERLCRDGSTVVEVLNYYDSHSLMVNTHNTHPLPELTLGLDICLLISSTKAAAIGICQDTTSTLSLWRYDSAWLHVHSSSS